MKQRTMRFAATGARIAIGVVIAAACAGGVVAGVSAPWPAVHNEPATATVTPVPGDSVLVCNGSFRALGRDASQADLMLSAAAPKLRIDADEGAAESAALKMAGIEGGVGAQTITGAVRDRTAPLIAASEAVRLDDDDLTGFAAAPCREARQSSWLVGGDVSTGASDVILLSNPGTVPATVDLHVYGLKRSSSTTVVPAQTQVGLSLASVSAGEKQPVIEVVATGAPVRATLQSALVRTLDPVGIDLQDGMSGPQEQLDLLGVRSAPNATGDDSTGIVLRMLSPQAETQAQVRVHKIGSAEVVDEFSVELTEAVPTEVSLGGLPEGAYDIEVDAGSPVVAAARQTARSDGHEDFSWMLPAPQFTGTAKFSVPAGAASTLYLGNSTDEPVTVTLEGPDGRTIEIEPGGSAHAAVKPAGYTLTSEQPVHAAIGMRGGEGSSAIAGWPLWAPPATQGAITVRQ